MGLLDSYNGYFEDPRIMGLLGLSAGMAGTNGNFGQGLSNGIAGGIAGMKAGYDMQNDRAKLDILNRQAMVKEDRRKLVSRFNPKTGQTEQVWLEPGQTDGPVAGLEAPKLHFQDYGGAVAPINAYTGQPMGDSIPKTQSPNSMMSNAVTMRGQDMQDTRKREEIEGNAVTFTPDSVRNAAARYNIDGTLPALGMGKAAAAARGEIMNEAARQAQGVNPDDQRIAQIGNKANSAALAKLQQQQSMVGAFEKNFTMNADLALEQSKKVDLTGVPLANKWINAGKRAVMGDPELSAYDAVIKSTSNEYAKIVSGSMGNTALAEGEIKKVEALLNSAQTPEQLEAVIKMMKLETQNRLKGFEEEKAGLRGTMGRQSISDGATTPPSAPTMQYTESDLQNTALKYGMSVEQVKKKLGVK